MAGLNAYSRFDRLVHRLAFSGAGVQLAAADLEDRLYKADLDQVTSGAPIFITSLPRAGTTILLTALSGAPELCCHLYRDMPFVMAPMLWSRMSGRFQTQSELAERAHGDGIKIGFDSPEAFEEVIWRAFWPEKFGTDGIALFAASDLNAEAQSFFDRHLAKIVALRSPETPPTGRYVSKNNGNVARLPLILRMFPDARILIPVRHPLTHAGSLHRQHLRFLERHGEDPFTERYMRDIGHYEFGTLHRPILFDTFRTHADGLTPADLDYWLAYWIAAFEHLSGLAAAAPDRVHLLNYEALCAGGPESGARLCDLVGLDPGLAETIGAPFRPAPDPGDALAAHQSLLRETAEALQDTLPWS